MSTYGGPHTHGGTDAPECTTCRSTTDREALAVGVERVEAERDEARAEVERRENARLAATVERDHLRAAVAALIEQPSITTVTGASVDAVFKTQLRALLDDPDAALRAVKAQALREAADAEEGRCTGDWNGTVCDSCKATAQRLRDRADRIEGGADDE